MKCFDKTEKWSTKVNYVDENNRVLGFDTDQCCCEWAEADKTWQDAEQGFIDQFGNYIDRGEAWEIAEKNGQIIRKCGGDNGTLFSENLY